MSLHFEADSPNQLLMNPKINLDEKKTLVELKEKFEKTYPTKNLFFISSSGSSKRSDESVKLIALPIQSVINSAKRFNQTFQADAKSSWGLVLPTFHVAGLSILARAQLAQAQVFSSDWKPENMNLWLEKHFIAFLSLVPAQVFDLVQLKIKCTPSIKKVFVGAGSLNQNLRQEFLQLGWPLVETYGMTETASMVAVKQQQDVFQALPFVELKVENQLLQIKCDSMAYAAIQKKKNEIKIEIFDQNGWFKTKDHVEFTSLEQPQKFKFMGRSDEYFKVLGEGVSLSELREKLDQIDPQPMTRHLLTIEEARFENLIVLAVDNSVTKERADRLVSQFNQVVRPYEKIQRLVQVKQIPRSVLGKVLVLELKEIVMQKLNRSSDD
jgi:o-succinylbenzoate---CoA ligase